MNEPGAIIVDDFSSLSGVNVADGLRRASGNTRLYLDLLRQFVERQSGSADRILALIGGGDLETAQRDAHTVKGVAGTIGAAAVQAAAGDLERAIRERADLTRVEQLRVTYAALLDALTSSLRQFLESQAKEEPRVEDGAAPPALDAVKTVVRSLGALLDDSDADAIELLHKERAAVRFLFTNERFASFERLVTDYSFDEAAAELRRAATEKGL